MADDKKGRLVLVLNSQHNELKHGEMLAASYNTEAVWGWGTPAGRQRAQRRAALIAEGGGLGPERGVLEIGCGTGLFTEMLSLTGCRITALDLSPDLLQKARKRNLPAESVVFVEGNFETYPFIKQFDAVVGSSILHHLDIYKAVPILLRLLKPGGRLCFAEPNMLNPQVFLERKLRFIRPLFYYISPDETAFIRWSLQRLLVQTGFVEVSITPFDWLHPAVPFALIKPVQAMQAVLEKLPLVREFSGSLLISARKP